MTMNRAALSFALLLFTTLPVSAQPIESEVLPPVQMAPQPKSSATSPAPAPATTPVQPAAKKNSSGYLPMGSASPADAPAPPVGNPYPPETPAATNATSGNNGMAGTSGGTSAYDLGAPTNAPTADITPPAPPATNSHADPLLQEATPIRNWQENQPPSTRGDDSELANKKFCNLKITFTSIGAGIDHKTAEKIKMYLVGNPDILSYTEHRWGKEGEVDYCVDIKEHRNRAKVYADLKRSLPPASAKAAPTNIIGDGFEPISTYR